MSYKAPTFIEARQILKALELTGGKVAEQCGMKNSRQVRKYTSEGEANTDMPYSVLFTLVAKNIGRFVTIENWRKELIEEKVLHSHKAQFHMTSESELQASYKP